MNASTSQPLTESDAFATLAEATALAALTRVAEAGAAEGDQFLPLAAWLEGQRHAPLARIRDGFLLSEAATALVVLLFAAGRSETVARAVSGLALGAGAAPHTAVPVWLARRAVPGLGAAELAAAGPLCRFGFVTADGQMAAADVGAQLRLAPAVADRLAGLSPRDPVLASRISALPGADPAEQERCAGGAALFEALRLGFGGRGPSGLPPALLVPELSAEEVGPALWALGLAPHVIAAAEIPTDPADRDRIAMVWSREAALDGAALIVAAVEGVADMAGLAGFVDRIAGQVVVAGLARIPPLGRGMHLFQPPTDAPGRSRLRWAAALGKDRARRLGRGLDRIAAQFRLDGPGTAAAVAAAGAAIDEASGAAEAEARLWHAAARAVPPADLAGVAVMEPGYGWDDLILPPAAEAALRRIELHIRHAGQVFEDWGFAARVGGAGSWRGRGVAALFAGPSGTGKTMAAEVLAAALDLRVMTLDLSQIISKYIGETAKNVAAAFAEAERLGAVMVWNEGDAIWGARGAVSSATDRHVNAEVGDLLQRIEAFSGLTVVTTNLRHAIDPAFLRRFRFSIDFPLPTATERLRLWSRAFPPQTPVEPINWQALAAFPLTGGAIRNIAMGAAFLAAGQGRAVSRDLIAAELAEELRKQNQPVPNIDWGTVP